MADSRICTIEGCGKRLQSRGRCENHYRQFLKTAPRVRSMVRGVCGAPECERLQWAHGYCRVHAHERLYPRKRTTPRESIAFVQNTVSATTNDCILWPFARDKDGYGIASMPVEGGKRRSRKTPAHRYLCILRHGEPASPKLLACHSCDNPPCVNPRHLSWGTQRSNILEAIERGRKKAPGRKLDVDKVTEILASNENHAEVARRFNVDASLVQKIRKGKAWRHVPRDVPKV